MRPKPTFDSEYLNFLLNSPTVLNVARQFSIPSLHQSNLNPARYGRLTVAIPDLDEQKLILQYLHINCQPLDAAIRNADRIAQRIAEYRTRLVADVVTGKLDVREAGGLLPEEVEVDIPGLEEEELDPEEIEEVGA